MATIRPDGPMRTTTPSFSRRAEYPYDQTTPRTAPPSEELQPNIDGLSFDEGLIGFLVGIPVVLVARYLTRRRSQQPMAL